MMLNLVPLTFKSLNTYDLSYTNHLESFFSEEFENQL